MFDLVKIQSALAQEKMDGWLFYNFKNLDASANNILSMPDNMLTRRWFYFIPQSGEPIKLVHKIESAALDHLPGLKRCYAGWKQLHHELWTFLSSYKKICMQYSPMNAIPYISTVDAGTVELIKSLGVEVVSSANLIQSFEAVWNESGRKSHCQAAQHLVEIVQQAFHYVADLIHAQQPIHEYQVQQYILGQFAQRKMIYDHPPIVAVNQNSGNPHYEPTVENSCPIKKDDFLLIDLWAKLDQPEAVYADITWVGMVAETVSKKHAEIFEIVRNARDAAVRFIKNGLQKKQAVCGYQVDDACRNVIEKAGYGEYFVHRTGHSIGQGVHWKGANIDNFETRDERHLTEGLCFSIEPGIYLPEFGVRSEIDVYIHNGQARVSPIPAQGQIIPILAQNWPNQLSDIC